MIKCGYTHREGAKRDVLKSRLFNMIHHSQSVREVLNGRIEVLVGGLIVTEHFAYPRQYVQEIEVIASLNERVSRIREL